MDVDGACGLTVDDGPIAHQAHQETEDTSLSKYENGNKEKKQNKHMHSFQSHF